MIKLRYSPISPLPPSNASAGKGALYTFECDKSKSGKALGEAQKPAKLGSPFLTQAISLAWEILGSAPLSSVKTQAHKQALSLGASMGHHSPRYTLASGKAWATFGALSEKPKGKEGRETPLGYQPAREKRGMLFDKESPLPAL